MIYWCRGRTYVGSVDYVRCHWTNGNYLQAPKLPVRENDAGMVFVANLSSVPIESSDEFNTIYKCVDCSNASPVVH